ncbi:MAG: hypothetical protein JXA22_09425 [Candidatus Thermoplasmatota archaeon]|nr:hypothetical protein [Candidatus Thermoplasmatota archaeon]
MELEARSAPLGGSIEIGYDTDVEILTLTMSSPDLSTLRAMLNSYLGLVGAALRTAGTTSGNI